MGTDLEAEVTDSSGGVRAEQHSDPGATGEGPRQTIFSVLEPDLELINVGFRHHVESRVTPSDYYPVKKYMSKLFFDENPIIAKKRRDE